MASTMAKIIVIMAKTPDGVIGNSQNPPFFLPWDKLTGDLKRFKETTENFVVIMGRITSEIFPKPLPNRVNVVVSRNKDWQPAEGFHKFNSLPQAIQYYENQTEKIFLIGGAKLVAESLNTGIVDEMILTETYEHFPGDIYFPAYDITLWKEVSREPFVDYGYDIVRYQRGSTGNL